MHRGPAGGAGGLGVAGSVGSGRGRQRRADARRGVAREGDVPLALWSLADPGSGDTGSGGSAGIASAGTAGVVDRDVPDPAHGAPDMQAPVLGRAPGVSVASVRAWAQAQGYPVGVRGRLSAQVRDAYLRAHPELLDPDGAGPETGAGVRGRAE
ncbi:Lsr2 family DNA-binding protein [Microbacterium sp. HSID17254]|uniref:Lsr2 family DNA-binding protein n=1 Tax=Microbacterium sp. HSID17254 TaxID=2419509 RepID=UPI00406D3488